MCIFKAVFGKHTCLILFLIILKPSGNNEESGFFRYFNEAFFAKKAENALECFKRKMEAKIRKDEEDTNKIVHRSNKEVKERIEDKLKEQQHNPDISGIGPHKLHISLSPDSYTPELRDQITNIILKYPDAVRDFKYVDAQRLQSGLDQLNEFSVALTPIKSKVKDGKLTEKADKEILELDKLVSKELEGQKKAHKRFLASESIYSIYSHNTQ